VYFLQFARCTVFSHSAINLLIMIAIRFTALYQLAPPIFVAGSHSSLSQTASELCLVLQYIPAKCLASGISWKKTRPWRKIFSKFLRARYIAIYKTRLPFSHGLHTNWIDAFPKRGMEAGQCCQVMGLYFWG
jgi:hypothetical protein